MFKGKGAFGKEFDSLLCLFARKKKSVLNYDLGVGGCLESPSRKVILNSEKKKRRKKVYDVLF